MRFERVNGAVHLLFTRDSMAPKLKANCGRWLSATSCQLAKEWHVELGLRYQRRKGNEMFMACRKFM